ncbi:MAG: radical SAM protein [Acidobacteria bacterium]|nr:radical SAM protein [Acidobacteriota bacterium]
MNLIKFFKTRYYIPSQSDSFLKKSFYFLASRKVPLFPKTVQFETHSACNAACIFCPYSFTHQGQPKGFMSDDLFKKIVMELKLHKVRRISPYMNNEPFLDKNIVEKLVFIKQEIPKSKIVLTTNGSKLFPNVVDELIKHNPLDYLYISFQGVEKEGYEETMRGSLKFEETMENVLYLVSKLKESRAKHPFKVIITMVATNKVDPIKAVNFWSEKGVKAKWTPLENRGGNIIDFKKLKPKDSSTRRFVNCTRLFKQAYILFNGDMVLCCTDYTRKAVLGNVEKTSIKEVWNSAKANSLRRLFFEGKLDDIPLCRDCEIADSYGEEEFEG